MDCFLGWSLGANDAANVFGTAVGTRMIRFQTAAIVCGIFVILGAVISGAGTTETLGKLGSINALPGAFAACVAAGLAVYLMTKFGLPVSTTQAIVGAIVGWNIYTGITHQHSSSHYYYWYMGVVPYHCWSNCHAFIYNNKKNFTS